MSKISIPERYQLGVSKIRDLDLEAVKAIRASLDRMATEPEISENSREPEIVAATAMESISRPSKSSDFATVGEALVSMYGVKSNSDLPLEEFVSGVADSLEEVPDPHLRLLPSQREEFTQKLTVLLNSDMFAISAKLSDLRTENERIFCHARILTDLRPVFGKDVNDGVVAMLLTHNLKISFHAAGRKGDHEIFVSMDTEDLEELRKTIERAQTKAKKVKAACSVHVYEA